MKPVLVIGDVILDSYTTSRKLGVSAETPTIVGELEKEETFLGGAGLVVRHLLELGENVHLISATGFDDPSMSSILGYNPRFTNHQFCAAEWSLTQKRRYFVDGYKLLQIDVLNKGKVSEDLWQFVKHVMESESFDRIVICDNGHGMFTAPHVHAILQQNAGTAKVYADCQISQKESRHAWFKGCDYMFLNEREFEALGGNFKSEGHFCNEMKRISEKHEWKNVILKEGRHGCTAYHQSANSTVPAFEAVPGNPVDVIDTCGAGDAFLAAYVHSGDLWFANDWASFSVTKLGTVVPTMEEYDATFA